MSAFTVSKTHIDVIVAAAVSLGEKKPDELGAMLWNENFLSVSTRYAPRDSMPEYKFEPPPPTIPVPFSKEQEHVEPTAAIVVFKAIRCLEFQSCEHAGWETSTAKQTCESLKCALYPNIASDRVLDESFTPEGWDDAPWAIGN